MGGLCGMGGGGRSGGVGMGRMGGMGRNSAGGMGYSPAMAGGVTASQGMPNMSQDRNSPFFQTQSGLPQYQRNLLAAGMGFQGAYDPNSYVGQNGGSSAWQQFLDTPEEQAQWKSTTQNALNNQSMFAGFNPQAPQMQRSQYAPMAVGAPGVQNNADILSGVLRSLMGGQQTNSAQSQMPTSSFPGAYGSGAGGMGLLAQLLGGGGQGMAYNTQTGPGQSPMNWQGRGNDMYAMQQRVNQRFPGLGSMI